MNIDKTRVYKGGTQEVRYPYVMGEWQSAKTKYRAVHVDETKVVLERVELNALGDPCWQWQGHCEVNSVMYDLLMEMKLQMYQHQAELDQAFQQGFSDGYSEGYGRREGHDEGHIAGIA